METEWICTDIDMNQYGRQLSGNIFEFKEFNRNIGLYFTQNQIDGELFNNDDYWIKLQIDLACYSEKEIEDMTSAYYSDLNELKEECREEDYNWIIAECIFEQESGLY